MFRKNTITRTAVLLLLPTAFMTSCKFEQEDYFDESASLRIEHTCDAIQDILVNGSQDGKNGWVMQYFVAGTSDADFEGFNIFASFGEDGSVTFASDHRFLRDGYANKYLESTSLYKILREEGPVLGFDTWNDVLSPLSDPVDPSQAPKTLVKDGQGMKGDYNLVVTDYNDDEILIRGERYSAHSRMIPCDRTWQQYIDDTKALKNAITNTSINSYYVVNEAGDTMYITGLKSGYYTYAERIVDPLTPVTKSCVFTPKGFRNEYSTDFGENSFQEFTMASDSTMLVNEDGTVRCIALWDQYILNHTAIWNFDTSLFTADQQSLYNQICTELKKYSSAWSVKSIGIGKSTGASSVIGIVLTCYTNTAKSKTNTIGMALDMARPQFGIQTISVSDNPTTDKNMQTVAKKATDMVSYVASFAKTISGTYSVKPDNYFLPTGATFTTDGSGTNFVIRK